MRRMRRRFLASAALAGLVGLVLAGAACLPELSALRGPIDGGEDAPAIVTGGCGDGFIDDDAGESCDPGDASVASCADCKVQCPGGTIDPASGHCYYVADAGTYQQAILACAGGHVVTLESDREAALVDGITSSPYWVGVSYQPAIGGYRSEVTTEPGFPADGGCTGCYVRTLARSDAGTDCVVSRDGGWTLSACDPATAGVVCEREPAGQRSFYCQGPWCSTVPFTLNDKRYLLYLDSAARSADEAAKECALYEGGRLVTFDSPEEREQLVREIIRLFGEEAPTFTAWIGLANDGGTWTWDDGTIADDGGRPSPWGAGQPSTSTGRAFIRVGPAFFDSQLAQSGEDVARPFICQRR
jgi:hypothetical protein